LGLELLVKRYPEDFVNWQFITPIESKIANLKLRREYAELRQIHPADMADIIEEMDHNVRRELIANMDDETAADALTEADLETQVQIISELDEERASDILEEMPPDEAADILGALSEDKSSQLLSKMDAEDAEDVRELMAYEEEEAGSLMTTEFIVFPKEITAGETIEKLREMAPDAETIYYVYVVDEQSKLQGVCSLRELILAQTDAKLGDFIHSRLISVRDTDERQEVFDTFLKYNLLAVPVVDAEEQMLGIITVDDVLHAVMKTRSKLKTFSHYMLASRKEEN
jgi:Mg2+ transporter MgtE